MCNNQVNKFNNLARKQLAGDFRNAAKFTPGPILGFMAVNGYGPTWAMVTAGGTWLALTVAAYFVTAKSPAPATPAAKPASKP